MVTFVRNSSNYMKLLFTLLGVLMLVLTACKSEKERASQVLNDFFEKIAERNFAAARLLATSSSTSTLDLLEIAVRTDPNEALKYNNSQKVYGSIEIKDSIASIPVLENEITTTYVLKKENGTWKVAFEKDLIFWNSH